MALREEMHHVLYRLCRGGAQAGSMVTCDTAVYRPGQKAARPQSANSKVRPPRLPAKPRDSNRAGPVTLTRCHALNAACMGLVFPGPHASDLDSETFRQHMHALEPILTSPLSR